MRRFTIGPMWVILAVAGIYVCGWVQAGRNDHHANAYCVDGASRVVGQELCTTNASGSTPNPGYTIAISTKVYSPSDWLDKSVAHIDPSDQDKRKKYGIPKTGAVPLRVEWWEDPNVPN